MPALRLPASITRHSASISKWATAGAWFFLVFSLASVVWALGQQWANPSGTTALYGGGAHYVWGLTYSGVLGLLLALVQLVTIGSAAVLSALPRTRFGPLAHRILIGWSGLWMLNLLWLASADLRVESFGQAALMTLLFGATVYRSTRRGKRISTTPIAREVAPDDDPVIVPDNGMPPAPVASRFERVKARADAAVVHARPAVQKAAARTRVGIDRLASRARPAMKSAFDAARRAIARIQSRLQNGWNTTSL